MKTLFLFILLLMAPAFAGTNDINCEKQNKADNQLTNKKTDSDYKKRLEAYNEQVRRADEQQAEAERQLKKSQEQQNITTEQIKTAAEQQRRMNTLLDRWEKQADRYDALLDKWEKTDKTNIK